MSAIRLAVRSLLRAPWFTLTAMLTIALGMGTSVTIFSVVDRALLRSLPYHDPDRLCVDCLAARDARSVFEELRAGTSMRGETASPSLPQSRPTGIGHIWRLGGP